MSNPIAVSAIAHSPQDYHMGSYTGEDGRFNPASYTRHFLGSPISWRAGSFGAQFVPSQSPTAMLVGSYDPAKSPQDTSILNAWNVFDRQGELCRNYTCCGIQLPDLHALLEHFEDVHIIVKDRSQPPSIQIPFNPQIHPAPTEPAPQPQQYSAPFDTDDMDLGLDDYEHASPPPPSTAPTSAGTSRAPSPTPSPTASNRPNLNIALSGVAFQGMHTPLSARAPPFSAYARYSNNPEYSPQEDAAVLQDAGAIAPALVFAIGEDMQSEPLAPEPVPVSAPVPAPAPAKPAKSKRNPPSPTSGPPSRAGTPASTSSSQPTPIAATAASAASLLLPHKPFRCPKPNCSKSYKQANGLKYHMTHGSCSFGPAKDVEAVRALLERKRAAAAAPVAVAEEEDEPTTPVSAGANAATATSAATTPALSPAELHDLDAKMRPFACGIGDCARRYKNMNGLRYHYQHSGDHGAVGLSLLAGGLHGCLKGNNNGAGATTPPTGAGTSVSVVNANATTSANANTASASAITNTNANAVAASGNANTVSSTKGKTTYAWGSTLLPHIQAVATTGTTTATATANSSPSSTPATSASNSPTPAPAAVKPSAKANKPGTTATFAITPQVVTPTGAQQQQQFTAQQAFASPEYLAQLQRAQYAQYQHAVAAGWFPVAQQQQQQQQQQVDVTMG